MGTPVTTGTNSLWNYIDPLGSEESIDGGLEVWYDCISSQSGTLETSATHWTMFDDNRGGTVFMVPVPPTDTVWNGPGLTNLAMDFNTDMPSYVNSYVHDLFPYLPECTGVGEGFPTPLVVAVQLTTTIGAPPAATTTAAPNGVTGGDPQPPLPSAGSGPGAHTAPGPATTINTLPATTIQAAPNGATGGDPQPPPAPADSGPAAYTAPSGQATFTVGSQTFTASAGGGVSIAGTTLWAGSGAVTTSGEVISVGSAGVVVSPADPSYAIGAYIASGIEASSGPAAATTYLFGGSAATADDPPDAVTVSGAVITVGSQVYTETAGGSLVLTIGGANGAPPTTTTLSANGPPATISGQVISIGTAGVVVGNSTAAFSAVATSYTPWLSYAISPPGE